MVCMNIDGILVWLTEEDRENGNPALILEYTQFPYHNDKGFDVFLSYPLGNRSDITHFDNLKDALMEFANRIP